MSSIRTISLDYGDTRISIYCIDLPSEKKVTADPVMHSHFYYEIHYAAEGHCLYRFASHELLLREKEMLVIPPGLLHGAIDLHSNSYKPQVLSLSLTQTDNPGSFFHSFSAMLSAASEKAICPVHSISGHLTVLQNRALYDSLMGIVTLKAAAGGLMLELFRLLQPLSETPDTPSPEPPCSEEITVLLENLVNRPDTTLEQIAASICYSPRHTARLIKSIYGASLSEVRRSRKNT